MNRLIILSLSIAMAAGPAAGSEPLSAAKRCRGNMTAKQVTDTIVSSINRGSFEDFKTCIGPGANAYEPGRRFRGRAGVLRWAKAEIFDVRGRLKVRHALNRGGKEIRCGRFQTPSFGFKVKYVFQSSKGKLIRWDLKYWRSKTCS